jgi:uncharacterized membrane protein YsdA (DUF1294 family)/cold shock CspA family protein
MRKKGTVVRWDSERSFGFIRSPDTVADIYFHRRDYEANREPIEGSVVIFDEIHVGGKGPRALKVEPARNTIEEAQSLPVDQRSVILPRSAVADRSTPPRQTQRELRLLGASLGLIALWALMWLTGIALGRLPALPVISGLVVLNIATFFIYLLDKEAAKNGGRRFSENQLHLLALLGGWPGAWCGQKILRHKSSKRSFQIVYWASVALNLLGLLAWLIWPALLAPAG